jgi:phosphoinositide-3-kinase regulatory subunit 4
VTAVKKFSDNRRFISGSCDGTVKLYDMRKIEDDFTNGSVSTVRIYEGDITSRVTALCPLEGTDSFVVGTNTGAVSLYTNEKQSSTYLKGDSEIRKIVD